MSLLFITCAVVYTNDDDKRGMSVSSIELVPHAHIVVRVAGVECVK